MHYTEAEARLRSLRRLTATGEGLHLEFKRKLPEADKLMREVAALANTEGGQLLIGVDDDGTVHGIRDPEEAEEFFRAAAEKYLHPQPEYALERVAVNRKRAVVVAEIAESGEKPVELLTEEGKQTLLRVADRSIKASREMRQILRHRSRPRDVKVEYGAKEQALMAFLQDAPHITLAEFMQAAGISRQTASRTLVHLVRANVLRVEPDEHADRYYSDF